LTLERLIETDALSLKELGGDFVGLQEKAKIWMQSASNSGKVLEQIAALKEEVKNLKDKLTEVEQERDEALAAVKQQSKGK
jgi:seryl-tRNA synthetase